MAPCHMIKILFNMINFYVNLSYRQQIEELEVNFF